MLHNYSAQYIHHNSILLQTLKKVSKQTFITDIYLTERCRKIILNQRLTQVDLFGCGYKKIYYKQNVSPYLKLQKIIIVTNVDQSSFNELDQIEYLFPEVYLLTLQNTNPKQAQIIRKSPLRKKLKEIQQINLNFFTFLDYAHYIAIMPKSSLTRDVKKQQQIVYSYKRPTVQTKLSAYRSFLLSYPKFYQYQLHYLKSNSNSYNNFVIELQTQLNESLEIMKKHQKDCKNLDKVSSPKIKFLVLNRQVVKDLISPLIYGYFYGSLCQQFVNRQNLFEGADKLTSKGKMYNKLFQKDFDQSSQYIQNITKDKTALDGPYQTNYFYKAKNVIVNFQDPSPMQLGLHISCWRQSRHLGQSHIKVAVLQQDIANRNNQYDRKVSNGDAVSQIRDWILQCTEQQQIYVTDDQLMKLVILAQSTKDLWFYHRSTLKGLFQDPKNKLKYERFLQRKQIPVKSLTQKYQSSTQQRSQLYRHQPLLVSICQKWIRQALGLQKGQNVSRDVQNIQFNVKYINDDVKKNRQNKLVILIDGIVGYNQLALMRRMIKQVTQKQVSIIVQSYCNSQQYVDYLTRP